MVVPVEPSLVPAHVRTISVLGLEVVLLASPFSTARAADVVAEHDVLVDTVVLSDADFLEPDTACTLLDWLTDLKVGVTVAEGLLETRGLALPSTRGLIGVVVVEAPTTLGSGADRWLLATGLTTAAAGDDGGGGGGGGGGAATATFGCCAGATAGGAGVTVGVTGAVDDVLAVVATVLMTEVVWGVTGRAVVICDRSGAEAFEAIEVVLAVVPASVDLTGTGAATMTGCVALAAGGDGRVLLAAPEAAVVVVIVAAAVAVVVVNSGADAAVVLLEKHDDGGGGGSGGATGLAGTDTLQFSPLAGIVGMSFGSADMNGAGLEGDEAVALFSDKTDMEL